MSKNARQIVASMLEDYASNSDDRAGGPKDAWRKGGFNKFNLKKMDAGGKRPGEAGSAVADDEEDEDTKEKPSEKPDRFKWKAKD